MHKFVSSLFKKKISLLLSATILEPKFQSQYYIHGQLSILSNDYGLAVSKWKQVESKTDWENVPLKLETLGLSLLSNRKYKEGLMSIKLD